MLLCALSLFPLCVGLLKSSATFWHDYKYCFFASKVSKPDRNHPSSNESIYIFTNFNQTKNPSANLIQIFVTELTMHISFCQTKHYGNKTSGCYLINYCTTMAHCSLQFGVLQVVFTFLKTEEQKREKNLLFQHYAFKSFQFSDLSHPSLTPHHNVFKENSWFTESSILTYLAHRLQPFHSSTVHILQGDLK